MGHHQYNFQFLNYLLKHPIQLKYLNLIHSQIQPKYLVLQYLIIIFHHFKLQIIKQNLFQDQHKHLHFKPIEFQHHLNFQHLIKHHRHQHLIELQLEVHQHINQFLMNLELLHIHQFRIKVQHHLMFQFNHM